MHETWYFVISGGKFPESLFLAQNSLFKILDEFYFFSRLGPYVRWEFLLWVESYVVDATFWNFSIFSCVLVDF